LKIESAHFAVFYFLLAVNNLTRLLFYAIIIKTQLKKVLSISIKNLPDVPMPYVRANQVGIVVFILLSTILQSPNLFLVLLWVIQISGSIFGSNLFIQLGKMFVKVEGKETQAGELQRFNMTLGILFLTVSLLCFANSWNMAGYIISWIFGIVALIALCGYCLGCNLYYQFKRIKSMRQISKNK
jgi:hypothetical protein